MVSQNIDSMVMVVKAGETDREAFRRAVKSLQGANVPLAGVVVNGISRKTSKDTYYYYYQSYYYDSYCYCYYYTILSLLLLLLALLFIIYDLLFII